MPGSGDSAVISASGTYTVTANNNVQIANLVLGGTAGTQLLSVGAFSLSVGNGSAVGTNGILNLNGSTLTGFLAVSGAINWTNGGTLSSASAVTVASNAVLNIGGSSPLNLYGMLTNAGTVNWGGTGNLIVYNGAFGYTGGIVNLAGAVFNVQNDQIIQATDYNGAVAYFNNAGLFQKGPTTGTTTINVAFNNTGTVNVESGTLSISTDTGNGSFTVASNASLSFSSLSLGNGGQLQITGAGPVSIGTLSGNNAIISGNWTWTGGGNLAAGNTMTVASNAVLNLSGSSPLNLYGMLTNAGTVNWGGTGNLIVYNGAFGYTGGIVNLAGAVFNVQNDQTIQVTDYNGAVAYFNNAGLFQKGPTTGTTTINVAFNNTGTVDVQSGTVNLNGNGAGNGQFIAEAGATLTVSGGYSANSGAAFLGAGTNLLTGGTFTANGSITSSNLVLAGATTAGGSSFSGLLTWTSGSIGGGSTLTIATNGILNISGSSPLNLYGVLTNAGTVNWGGTGNLAVYNGAYGYTGGIVNLAGALFNVQNDQTIQVTDYNGAVAYFNNAGTFLKSAGTNTTINVAFNNAGLVNMESGTLTFNGGLTGTSGAVFTGAGTNLLSAGTFTVNANITISNLLLTVTTLSGNGVVSGSFAWLGGTLNSGSTLTIATNGILNISGSSPLNLYGMLTNAGTVNWSGTGNLAVYNGAYGYTGGIVNLAGALFNVQNDQTIQVTDYNGAVAYFNNAGTFLKSAGTNTTINVAFNNAGLVNMESGTLTFNGGLTGTSGAVFTGAGTNLLSAGTFTVNANITISNLLLTVTTLSGSGVVSGSFAWLGGTLNSGSTLTIATNGILNISGSSPLNLYGMLTNAGTVNWSGTGNLAVYNGAYGYTGGIVNLAGALFNVQNDQTIQVTDYNGAVAYFNNAGTFLKSAGANTTINVAFNNTGLVNVESGTLTFNGGGAGNGAFIGAANASINVTGGTLTVNNGTLENLVLSGGTLALSGSITSSNFVLVGGTLVGNNAVISGVMSWTGGTLNSGSTLTIATNGVLNISGSSAFNLYGMLTNAGTVNWGGTGNLAVYNGAYGYTGGIVNLAGALFNVQNDQTIQVTDYNGAVAYFNNAGTFLKSAGTNTTINVAFNNAGLVNMESGTLTFNGGLTGTSGAVFAGAGTNLLNVATFTVNANITISNLLLTVTTLSGNGVVSGLFAWTGGSLAGGSTLTIATNGILNIGGSSPLNLYGMLTNAGTVNWGGTGNLIVYNGAFGYTGGIVNLAGAVFNVQNDQIIQATDYNGAVAYFNNAGLFQKGPTTGTTTINVAFNNTGTVNVESGTLSISTDTGNGSFTVASNASLSFSSLSLGNGGQLQITGAGPVSIGTLSGNNAIISGNWTWTGGGNLAAGNTMTVASNAVLNLSGSSPLNLYGMLTNAGTVNWGGTGNLIVYNGAFGYTGGIVNLAGAVFNVQNDQTIQVTDYNGAVAYFNNAGLFQKGPTTGTTTINVAFNNTGTVDVQSGTVNLNGNGAGNGQFIAEAGATLTVSGGYSANSGAAFLGAGTNLLTGGTFTANGSITSSNLVLAGATTAAAAASAACSLGRAAQ